jgi:hypothetical protein
VRNRDSYAGWVIFFANAASKIRVFCAVMVCYCCDSAYIVFVLGQPTAVVVFPQAFKKITSIKDMGTQERH